MNLQELLIFVSVKSQTRCETRTESYRT